MGDGDGDGDGGLEPLFPLIPGNVWTYRQVDPTVPCGSLGPEEPVVHVVEDAGVVEGLPAVRVEFGEGCYRQYENIDEYPFLSVSETDADDVRYRIPTWEAMEDWGAWLTAPVVDGAVFDGYPQSDYRYEYLGTQTVEAGTFDECWRVGVSYTIPFDPNIYQVYTRQRDYCRGVGVVRFWGRDTTMEGNVPIVYLELTEYDLQ